MCAFVILSPPTVDEESVWFSVILSDLSSIALAKEEAKNLASEVIASEANQSHI